MRKQLALLLVFLLAAMPVNGLWTQKVKAAYDYDGRGDGSETNPYIILTAEDLDGVRENLTASYKLGADIDLSAFGNWEPIGGYGAPFLGTFDGDFHTIKGMTINSSAGDLGLFGSVNGQTPVFPTPVRIKNVRLENVDITATDPTSQVGGLSGVIADHAKTEGIYVSGTISGIGYTAGGIVGQMRNGMSNSEAHVEIEGSFRHAGGLTGIAGGGAVIEQSYATGDVLTSGEMAGGLVGWATGMQAINSYATGNVTLLDGGVPWSYPGAGGLIGQAFDSVTLTNSYASGNVTADIGRAGGLIGNRTSPPPTIHLNGSYWKATVPPLAAVGGGTDYDGAVSESDMLDWNTYDGWNSAIWGIRDGESLPYLNRFAPEVRVAQLESDYGTSAPGNELAVNVTVRDGSIGEPLKIRLALNNAQDAMVAEKEYTLNASGLSQPLAEWAVAFDEVQYPAGTYHLIVTVEDTVGAHAWERTLFFDINDTTAPAAPVLTGPTDGASLNDTTPTISGSAEPGSTVTIILDGSDAGTVSVGAGGAWTWTPPTALGEGDHSVVVRAEDEAGNVGPDSAARTFTVDTTAPAAPVLTGPTDGASLNDTTPTISGSAEPGSTVTIILDGSDAGTVPVGAGGAWTWTPPTALGEGDHTVQVRAEDAAGNVGPDSDTNTFTVDTTAPAAPVLTGPSDGASLNVTTPTISGTAEAGSTVTIILDGIDAGTVSVGAGGAWTWTPPTALGEGDHTVQVRAEDAAGNVGPGSAARTFTVDTTPPTAPVLTGPTDGASLNDTTPMISGTAEPASTVTIILDGSDAGTVPVGAGGAWTWTPPTALGEGDHSVVVRAEDEAGNVGPDSAARTFTVDTTAPAAPVLTGPTDGASLNDTTPTISGSAEPGSTVTIILDGSDAGTVSVGAGGAWTWTPPTALGQGDHSVVVRAEDAAGNVGPDSAARTFTVDTTAPAAPVLTGPTDGASLNDTTPTISGSAEPGSTVTIILDGSDAGTVPVGAGGTWTWTPPTALGEGDHSVVVRAEDEAGNVGSDSDTNTFTVDVTAPVITLQGSATMTILTGDVFVDPGATAEDALEGAVLVTVTGHVDHLTPGDYELTYRAQDSAGNLAAEVTRTVRVNAPSIPVYYSNNADLKQLTITADGAEQQLTPLFAPETTSYKLETTAEQVDIGAVKAHSGATVTLKEERLPASGIWTLDLAEGDNLFDIKVTAENGTVKTYRLTVVRLADQEQLEPTACAFRDIAGHWAEDPICEAAALGVVQGDDAGMFHPQRQVTRIEFAAMLLRALEVSTEGESRALTFADADRIPDWAKDVASAAVKAGVLEGYLDGTLRPLQTVSRSEMAAMMTRALERSLSEGEGGEASASGGTAAPFADDADIPDWARAYIYTAAQHGLLLGRGDNLFVPNGLATRAEATVTILRLWQIIQ